MANLDEVLESMKELFESVYEEMPDDDEVFVYRDVPDVSQTPALVIMPAPRDTAEFNGAFGKGLDTWNIDVIVMVAEGEWTVSQKELAKFIDGDGAFSVRRILYANANLGLQRTDANCDGVRLYGGKFDNANVPHIGAVIKVTVRTSGP